MKLILLLAMVMYFSDSKGQKVEFDMACTYILNTYRNELGHLKKHCPVLNTGLNRNAKYDFFINETIIRGEYDWYLYLKNKISADSLTTIRNNESMASEISKSLFGKPLHFDPTHSRYYKKRSSKNHLGGGGLISFSEFDGRFLLINVKIGCDVYSFNSHHSEYDYQFEFKNGSMVDVSYKEKRF